MNDAPPPDLDPAQIAATLDQIERLVRRLRRQLGDPQPTSRRRRKITLREAALRSLSSRDWMSLSDWERAMLALGYQPPKAAKREDQTRRSLASLVARHRHLIDADGRGNYRLRVNPDETDPLLQ